MQKGMVAGIGVCYPVHAVILQCHGMGGRPGLDIELTYDIIVHSQY